MSFSTQLAALKQSTALAAPAGDLALESFDEQRERRNREMNASLGLESLDASADASLIDANLPTGEFGDDADINRTKDGDTNVDADPTKVAFKSEDEGGDTEFEPLDDDEDDNDDVLDGIIEQTIDLEAMETNMAMVVEAALAVEAFGYNPSVAGVMNVTGLLSGTALESMGLETLTFAGPNDDQTKFALEQLEGKLSDTEGKWSVKILKLASETSAKVMSVLQPLWTKISATSAKLASAGWDKAKQAGATMKAHPYATVAGALAAALAVAGVVMYVTQGFPAPGAKIDDMKKFMTSLKDHINKIDSPIAKVTATLNDAGTKIMLAVTKTAAAMKSGGATALGWSQSSVNIITGNAKRVAEGSKTAWTALGERIPKLVEGAKTTAKRVVGETKSFGLHVVKDMLSKNDEMVSRAGKGNIGGAMSSYLGYVAYGMMISLTIRTVVRLVTTLVTGAFRMVAAAFRAIVSLVS